MAVATHLLIAGGGASFAPPSQPPMDASWSRSASNPILSPALAWEETAVFEPCVIKNGSTWQMWYGGGWAHPGLGYATSTDGVTWTKHAGNPVYGQGGSGYANTSASAEVVLIDGTYWLFTSGGTSTTDIRSTFRVATSSDGITWTTQASSASLPAGTTLWGNRSVWVEGSTWYMLQEARLTAGAYWATYLYTSSDGLTWNIGNGGAQLSTLRLHATGSYGGAHVRRVGSTYHVWYHAVTVAGDLPTDIYHATSTDRINWTVSPGTPVLTHTGSGNEVDQVADPSIVVYGGTAYLFYDGDDNGSSAAWIMLATAPAE